MARGKDAPAITGGQIDPYVTSTLQQEKQQTQNRLLTAMQEKGATERAGIAASAQLGTQAMRSQADVQVQAARSASDDKQAAEAEVARREDRKFAEAMQESTQVFRAKQAGLAKEHDAAMVKGDREYAEKIMEKQNALRRFGIEKQTAAQERSTNAVLSILKGSLQRESSKEKAITVLGQEADKFDKDKEIYERTKSRVIENTSSDKRLDLPIKGEYTVKAGPSMGFLSPPTAGPRVLTPGTQADPMGVLQDQLDKQKANVSVEQLSPEKINQLEDAIQNGEVAAEDVRSTLGVLEGMLEVVGQKRNDHPLSEDEATYDFWNTSYHNIIRMRDSVEDLADSKKKVSGSDTETVGARVQYALGVIRDNSLGGRAARLRELNSGDFNAVFEEMTKSLQVPTPHIIDPNMTKYEQEIRQEENDMLQRLGFNLGGTE